MTSDGTEEPLGREPDDVVWVRGADGESPSLAVVAAVSRARRCDPVELEPLAAAVDTDALDSLVSGRTPADVGPHVTFDYAGFVVEVRNDGRLTVALREGRTHTA